MEYIEISKEMIRVNKRITDCMNEYFKLALEKAETERLYRIALQQEMLKLRHDKVQATLIPDIARGITAELKFNRDLAKAKYNVTRDSLRALMAELNSYQTIIRFQSELESEENDQRRI